MAHTLAHATPAMLTSYCCSTGPSMFLPQDLYTCCSFSIEYSSPRNPHDLSLDFIRVYYLNTSYPPIIPCLHYSKLSLPHPPISVPILHIIYVLIVCSMRAGTMSVLFTAAFPVPERGLAHRRCSMSTCCIKNQRTYS